MNIKHLLVSAALLVATASAFADGVMLQSGRAAPVRAPNVVANGLVQAPGASLLYFSDANYPVQPAVKSNVSRAEVKADMVQAASGNQVSN